MQSVCPVTEPCTLLQPDRSFYDLSWLAAHVLWPFGCQWCIRGRCWTYRIKLTSGAAKKRRASRCFRVFAPAATQEYTDIQLFLTVGISSVVVTVKGGFCSAKQPFPRISSLYRGCQCNGRRYIKLLLTQKPSCSLGMAKPCSNGIKALHHDPRRSLKTAARNSCQASLS